MRGTVITLSLDMIITEVIATDSSYSSVQRERVVQSVNHTQDAESERTIVLNSNPYICTAPLPIDFDERTMNDRGAPRAIEGTREIDNI